MRLNRGPGSNISECTLTVDNQLKLSYFGLTWYVCGCRPSRYKYRENTLVFNICNIHLAISILLSVGYRYSGHQFKVVYPNLSTSATILEKEHAENLARAGILLKYNCHGNQE